MKLGIFLLCIIALAVLAITGCATAPVSMQESHPIQTDHVLASPAARVADLQQGGHLIIVRDSGFEGGGTNLRVSIDGRAVADLRPSHRYNVFLKEGEYIVAVIPVPNLFSANTAAEAAVTVKRGQTYVYRAGFNMGGVILQRSTLSGR